MSPASPSTRRRLVFAGLYLCEGAPIGFLWWALPTILRERGAPIDEIGALTSWLVLPWAFKFLWAPLLDAGGGCGLRVWIIAMQLVMALTLLPVLAVDAGLGMRWIGAALVLHALAAASQDAAIDSLALRTTPEAERGRLNGWMQLGMLLGRSVFGGGALLARRWIGDSGVVLLLSGGLASTALALAWRGRAILKPVLRAGTESLGLHLAQALKSRRTWFGLAFAATSGAGFEVVGMFAGPMLIDHGQNSSTVGLFLGLPAVGAMALGSLVGGSLSDRLGVRRVVLFSGLALGGAILALSALLQAQAPTFALIAALCAVYLAIGLFTASTYALFMALTDPALGATQFSAYMGATNLCESWSSRVGGALAEQRGYAGAFAIPALIGLAALSLLFALRPRTRDASRIGSGDPVD
ncbi:MAG: MFS transporter [Planctomycetes bacterium]|nr:MFS transporter [Planctomycetota bacterium]